MNIPPTIKTIPVPAPFSRSYSNHAAAAPHLQTVEPPPCAIQATAPLEEAESHRQRRQKPPLSYCQPHQEGHKHGAIHLCCADQILAECAPPEQWRLNFSLTHLSQVGSPGTLPHGKKMLSEQGVANLLDALVAIWAVGDPLMAAIGADIARLAGLALMFRGWRGRRGGRWRGRRRWRWGWRW